MVIFGLILAIYDTATKGLYGYFIFLFFTFLVLLLVSAKLKRGPLANWLSKPVEDIKNTLTGRRK
jgi:F0F1-type ATP synthase membrane subunit b/b'